MSFRTAEHRYCNTKIYCTKYQIPEDDKVKIVVMYLTNTS